MASSIDPMVSRQWFDDNTYYQILLIEYNEPNPSGEQYIRTAIETKKRGEFKSYKIDPSQIKLIKNLESRDDNIGSLLPSLGVTLNKSFMEALFSSCSQQTESNPNKLSEKNSPDQKSILNYVSEINNFYDSIRMLMITRKISQLIAKTWYTYLEAKKHKTVWEDFKSGKWEEFFNHQKIDENYKLSPDVLDGLIAREIFFFDQRFNPMNIKETEFPIYHPLHSNVKQNRNEKYDTEEKVNTRFLILPSSKAWQGVALSLLLAGQAYYKVPAQDYYHQISPPILSTGEIVMKYGFDVYWNQFTGIINEVPVSARDYSIAFPVSIPYPPIPSEDNLSLEQIRIWAQAEDNGGDFPFYQKNAEGEYLINVQNFTPPYPYIPLTCS